MDRSALLFESSTPGPSNMMVAQIVKLMQISMMKMRKTLSCLKIAGFLVGTLLITAQLPKTVELMKFQLSGVISSWEEIS